LIIFWTFDVFIFNVLTLSLNSWVIGHYFVWMKLCATVVWVEKHGSEK
jgi:hypothetical protein